MNEPRKPIDEQRLDELVRDLAQDYNLPATELDEGRRADLFARIQEERRRAARPKSPAPRPVPRVAWYAAMAAVLVLGFALGRMAPTSDSPVEGTGIEAVAESPDDRTQANAYQFAARDYLERTENLLVMLRRTAYSPDANTPWDTGSAEPTVGWANELLRETRLLQDSPAAHDDPQLAQLLEDLELLLAQIVQATAGNDELDEYQVTDPAMLERLRSEIDRNALMNEI